MIIKSFSKINLTLKVNSKTKNGLHEIQSLYTWINLFDIIKINKIKVDGGMVKNEQFLQFLSDILLSECDRPKITETTSLGAAYLAGLSVGMLKNTKEISKKWQSQKLFKPKLHKKEVKYLYQGWLKAVNKIIVKKNRK